MEKDNQNGNPPNHYRFGLPPYNTPRDPAQEYLQIHPAQDYPTQGYPTQGYPIQGYPTQGYPVQGYPTQGYPAQGYPTQNNPPFTDPSATPQVTYSVGQPNVIYQTALVNNKSCFNFTAAIVISCLVYWLCGVLFGGIAFILAIVGQSQESNGQNARTLLRASLILSLVGVIVGVVAIITVVTLSVRYYGYNYYYYF